jgi:hypothetical protein
MAVAREVSVKIAREQGNRLAEQAGGRSLKNLAGSLDAWTKDDALKLDVLEQTDESFAFDVTRCRFAELYHALGIPELGAALSCNRDGAMIEGFNPDIELTRTQTIMQGATHCDFRYRLHSLGKKPKYPPRAHGKARSGEKRAHLRCRVDSRVRTLADEDRRHVVETA